MTKRTIIDIEVKRPFDSDPPCFNVIANTRRAGTFIRKWMTDDEPTRGHDGRLFLTMFDCDTRGFLADAARAGLTF